jgi:hypothetical protein
MSEMLNFILQVFHLLPPQYSNTFNTILFCRVLITVHYTQNLQAFRQSFVQCIFKHIKMGKVQNLGGCNIKYTQHSNIF